MKKSIVIFGSILIALSLTSFAYLNWSNNNSDPIPPSVESFSGFDYAKSLSMFADPELVYKVDSRFMTTVTKERLHNAKSIVDILPEKATRSIVSYHSSGVSVLKSDKPNDDLKTGANEILNDAQINLLRTADYSDNFFVRSDFKIKFENSDIEGNNYLTYYITVVPEKEAEYISGHNALIVYLKENSKEQTGIIKRDRLRPGQVSFTVTKGGTIADVKLAASSGYSSVDKTLVELVTDIPGEWNPATNSNGDKVDQELVFFFGLEGC